MCVHIKVHMNRCHIYAVYALMRSIGVRMNIHLNVHRCHIFDGRTYGVLVCACTSMCICTGVTYWQCPWCGARGCACTSECHIFAVSHICRKHGSGARGCACTSMCMCTGVTYLQHNMVAERGGVHALPSVHVHLKGLLTPGTC